MHENNLYIHVEASMSSDFNHFMNKPQIKQTW